MACESTTYAYFSGNNNNNNNTGKDSSKSKPDEKESREEEFISLSGDNVLTCVILLVSAGMPMYPEWTYDQSSNN